jgi:hypothetical protein
MAPDETIADLRDGICGNERLALREVYDLYDVQLSQGDSILNWSECVESLVSSEEAPILLQPPVGSRKRVCTGENDDVEDALGILTDIAIWCKRQYRFNYMSGIGPTIQDVLRARSGTEGIEWSIRHHDPSSRKFPDFFSRYQWILISDVNDILSGACDADISPQMLRDLENILSL